MRVTREAFGKVGLTRMSVNILGGLFEIGDEVWLQKMGEDDNWTDQPIDLSDYVGRYEYLGSAVSIYFQFAAADMLQWQFPRMFDSQGQYDQYRDAIVSELGEPASFAKGTQYQLKAHAECHHAPTSLNYWHLEVKTIVDSIPPEEIENYSGAPRKRPSTK
ncbi:MAG: hypothetical protein NC453_31105 [Muribaculum sp.]|nr:hypothetical protein [Muribaculum sp.]